MKNLCYVNTRKYREICRAVILPPDLLWLFWVTHKFSSIIFLLCCVTINIFILGNKMTTSVSGPSLCCILSAPRHLWTGLEENRICQPAMNLQSLAGKTILSLGFLNKCIGILENHSGSLSFFQSLFFLGGIEKKTGTQNDSLEYL